MRSQPLSRGSRRARGPQQNKVIPTNQEEVARRVGPKRPVLPGPVFFSKEGDVQNCFKGAVIGSKAFLASSQI